MDKLLIEHVARAIHDAKIRSCWMPSAWDERRMKEPWEKPNKASPDQPWHDISRDQAIAAIEAVNSYKHSETDLLGKNLRNQITSSLDSAIQSTQKSDALAAEFSQRGLSYKNTVPCCSCGKAMEDRGAAAQWCKECYDNPTKPSEET